MRVAVVGAGIVGCCSAYYLAREGFQVTVYDADLDGSLSCSYGNAGMIVPSHFIPLANPSAVRLGLRYLFSRSSPLGFRWPPSLNLLQWAVMFAASSRRSSLQDSYRVLSDLNLASRALYVEFRESLGDVFELAENGLLMLCADESTFREEREVATEGRKLGLDVDELGPTEIECCDPGIRVAAAGALHFKDDAHFHPAKFMVALKAECERLNVRFQRSTIERLSLEGDRARLPSGEFDWIVLAGGLATTSLAQGIGLRLPMQSGKGYSFMHPSEVKPTICSLLIEARVAVTPLDEGIRFGGTMEIGACTGRVDTRRLDGIRNAVPRYFPDLPLPTPTTVWEGLRPCSPDGMPFLGTTRAAKNVLVATGHSMMGMSLGPITGKLVADLAAGRKLPPPVEQQLSPDRYNSA